MVVGRDRYLSDYTQMSLVSLDLYLISRWCLFIYLLLYPRVRNSLGFLDLSLTRMIVILVGKSLAEGTAFLDWVPKSREFATMGQTLILVAQVFFLVDSKPPRKKNEEKKKIQE